MIYAIWYRLACGICGVAFGEADNRWTLRRDALAEGWRFGRRKDGRMAKRGGKDYCPKCIPEEWSE